MGPLILRDAERLPLRVVGPGLSDEAVDELAGAPLRGAGEVSGRRARLPHQGRMVDPREAEGGVVGEREQGDFRSHGHPRELD